LSEPVLAVEALHVAYGPIKAVRGCTLRLDAGETVAVVGANGAGKTTLLRALSNLLPHESGSVRYLGAPTERAGPHELARRGLFHIPEGRGTLGRLEVRENLRIAYDVRPADRSFEAALERVFERFPRLRERHDQLAGTLSGGEQQMLALARALINPPRVLAPALVEEAFAVLGEFHAEGIAILLVEQNVYSALRLAQRGYVLRQGEIVMEGPSAKLLADAEMLKHYLG